MSSKPLLFIDHEKIWKLFTTKSTPCSSLLDNGIAPLRFHKRVSIGKKGTTFSLSVPTHHFLGNTPTRALNFFVAHGLIYHIPVFIA